jgi:hypothetical protein
MVYTYVSIATNLGITNPAPRAIKYSKYDPRFDLFDLRAALIDKEAL